MLVFLNFDGVLHPNGKDQQHFCYLPEFEACMLQCATIQIVITSTWRMAFTIGELKANFSKDIRQCIFGVTPEIEDGRKWPRSREIQAFLDSRKLEAPWVAIDNEPALFHPDTPLVATDSQLGFDSKAANKLVTWYRRTLVSYR